MNPYFYPRTHSTQGKFCNLLLHFAFFFGNFVYFYIADLRNIPPSLLLTSDHSTETEK